MLRLQVEGSSLVSIHLPTRATSTYAALGTAGKKGGPPASGFNWPRAERILRRRDPFRESPPPPAREPAVVERRNPGRATARNHRQESRLNQFAFPRLGKRWEVARRRFVGFAGLRHVAALEIDLDALRRGAGDRLVARTIGGEPIIGIAKSGRDGQRVGELPLQLSELRLQRSAR